MSLSAPRAPSTFCGGMPPPGAINQAMPLDFPITKDLRKLLQFGAGVGIEIAASNLEIVAARVRPNGVKVLGRLTIADFAARPAAEWGADYARFLSSHGLSHVSATVLLPRRDV